MPNKVDQDGEFQAYATRVKADHYLHLGALAVLLVYIFQLHGVWAALAGLILIPFTISTMNRVILAAGGSFKLIRINRWAWLIGLYILFAASSATIESVR